MLFTLKATLLKKKALFHLFFFEEGRNAFLLSKVIGDIKKEGTTKQEIHPHLPFLNFQLPQYRDKESD